MKKKLLGLGVAVVMFLVGVYLLVIGSYKYTPQSEKGIDLGLGLLLVVIFFLYVVYGQPNQNLRQ